MMKARKYNRRIINANTQLHILAMQDSTFMTDELIKYVAGRDSSIRNDLNELRIVLNNAKEYGSIISVTQLHYDALYSRIQEIESTPVESLIDVQYQRSSIEELLPLIRQAEILAGKYNVVATNPPYMNKYSARLKAYISEHYDEYKGDLFSVFVYRNFGFCKANGYSGFMTPMVWMFIKTYESLRKYIIGEKSITTLIQFEYSAFEEATVPICSFVLKNGRETMKGTYFKLSDFRGGMEVQRQKVEEAIENRDCGYYHEADETSFSKIPGAPIAYWVSKRLYDCFDIGKSLSSIAVPKVGLQTGENDRFVRFWHEVRINNLFLQAKSRSEALTSGIKWFPYNKGGDFRKWYGNNDYVVNWQNDGDEIRHFTDEKGKLRSRPQNVDTYFLESITWSKISSGTIAFRYKPFGHIYDVAGTSVFANHQLLMYLHGFCNSCVAMKVASVLSPTINYEVGHIASFPIILDETMEGRINELVEQLILISKYDWDSFETSWDFLRHPLVVDHREYCDQMELNCNAEARQVSVSLISKRFNMWMAACEERFSQLKANEEELNRIFIDIYGLQEELTPDVADKDVTVRKADLGRDIRSLISYAVGCMMGRYSLDKPWDASQYTSYMPDHDGILPITDDEYFDDDIVGMFVNWVRTVYGADTLEENLRFIANALGGKGTPREVIRQYFLNDFYADHLKIYQKRPIYWLFSSGKKNGFKCLIYMHRYQPDLLARIRTDYVHEQQERYRTQLTMLEDSLQTAGASERVKLNKQITKIKDQALELQKYEEKIHHLADQMIPIDLDDGVKVNYAKFQDVLEKIK